MKPPFLTNATVYFVDMTKQECDLLNNDRRGWGSPIGTAYLRAQNGIFDDESIKFLRPAAKTFIDGDSVEEVLEGIWCTLQNHFVSWTQNAHVNCLTDFPRSMSVGDLVLFEDGSGYRCASIGFEEFDVAGAVAQLNKGNNV